MRQRVSLDTYVWNNRVTPHIFFERMPYMFKHFDFIPSANPKYAIVSTLAKRKPPPGAIRIFYTGENIRPNMRNCTWAFSFCYDEELKHPRHMRLPNYTRVGAGTDLIKPPTYDPEKVLRTKTKFCAFVYWNSVSFRTKAFTALSKYKHVDSPGRAHNNMTPIEKVKNLGQLRRQRSVVFYKSYDLKLKFLRPYKFVFGFENTSSPGYTTEKLYHAMLVNSVPLYWGNKLIHRDFNTRSFINYHDFDSMKDFIDRIIEVDQNDQLYMDYLAQPWYPNNKVTKYTDARRIVKQFKKIFRSG